MPECPNCGSALEDESDNDALADDEMFDYFCIACGELYEEGDLE